MAKIFVHFTIKGDNLDVDKLAADVPVKSKLFHKDEVVECKFNKTFLQKTNRFVYSIESQNGEKVNGVLKRMKKDFGAYIKRVFEYTSKHQSILDIVIYEDKQITVFNTKLSKESIAFINKLNTRVSISIFDW